VLKGQQVQLVRLAQLAQRQQLLDRLAHKVFKVPQVLLDLQVLLVRLDQQVL
jgi:hypothetical protein